MAVNTQEERFFSSVRHALAQGYNQKDFYKIVLVLGVTLGFSLSIVWLLKNRYLLRRKFTFYLRVLFGKAELADRRWKVDTPVSIVIPLSNRPLERHHAVNLSKGGIFLKTFTPYALNTSFEFILQLDKGTRIKGLALVRWIHQESTASSPRGMGCEFVNLSEADTNKIRLYLRQKNYNKE